VVLPWDTARVRYSFCQDKTLFLSTDSGLVIMDISDPASPTELGRLAADSLEKLWVHGNRAYLASGYLGLLVVDVSDPTAPESLGRYQVGSFEFVRDVWAGENVAYIAYAKRYGESILDSLPEATIQRGLASDLPAIAKEWVESF
jgi:hypothetical protein